MNILANKAKYAGHNSLAEMVKHHIPVWRDSLIKQKWYFKERHDADNIAYIEHELTALIKIEVAVNIELAETCNKKT